MANRKRLTKPKRGQFLSILRDCGTVTAAAKAIGITRQAAYLAKHKYPTFALEWEQAIESATDKLVTTAIKRAHDGSDALLMFLLRGHRPSVYAPEHSPEAPQTIDKPVLNVIETARQVCLTLEVAKQMLEHQEPIEHDPVQQRTSLKYGSSAG